MASHYDKLFLDLKAAMGGNGCKEGACCFPKKQEPIAPLLLQVNN